VIFWKSFFKLSYVYLSLDQRKTLWSKKNLVWFSEKRFPFILDGKHFSEVLKNLKISCYFLIISNLILKFLITIYIVSNLFFSISSLKIWFNLIFISIWILILLIVIYFIWNNLWNCNLFLILLSFIFLSITFDLY